MEWPKQPVTQDHFYSINAAQNDDILCNNTIPLIFVFGIVSALPLANRSSSHCHQRLFRHCNFVFDICTAGGRWSMFCRNTFDQLCHFQGDGFVSATDCWNTGLWWKMKKNVCYCESLIFLIGDIVNNFSLCWPPDGRCP